MKSAERIRFLASIDLFANFAEEDLVRLSPHIKEISCPAGTLVCQEGDPGVEMFVLVRGALRIFKEKRTIAMITPVDYVGEMALLETKPRSASIEAVEDSHLLVIPAEQFRSLLANLPPFLIGLTQVLSRRIRRDTEMLADEFEKANIFIHDMRNMLSVFLLLPGLKKKVRDQQMIGQIDTMIQARDHLAAMMEEALANAKRLQYRVPLQKGSVVALAEGVISSEARVHPDLHDKRISLRVEGDIPEFIFNSLEIRRVLLNLLINAGQASGKGGKIEVTIRAGGKSAFVAVRDHGCGIAEDIREKIFRPHFTTKDTGSGLGLAACRRIIETSHGGSIDFKTAPKGGTTFSFTLPLKRTGEDDRRP